VVRGTPGNLQAQQLILAERDNRPFEATLYFSGLPTTRELTPKSRLADPIEFLHSVA
jgi:hypothetical protein